MDPRKALSSPLYLQYLGSRGRYEDVQDIGQRAVKLDPLSQSVRLVFGWACLQQGHFDDAIEQFRLGLELDPNHGWLRIMLGRAYLEKDLPAAALQEMEIARQLDANDPMQLGFLGYAYAVSGRNAEAQAVLQRLDELERTRYVSRIARAYVYIGLGDKDRAFEWLNRAVAERSDSLAWFQVDPESKTLRADPRYPALLKQIGTSN